MKIASDHITSPTLLKCLLRALRMRSWISLKVESILYQLLEFDVQHYWFLKTNEDLYPDREQSQLTAKVLSPLRDTLQQLIAFLPRVLLITTKVVSENSPTSNRSCTKFLDTLSIRLSPLETELLKFPPLNIRTPSLHS